MSQPDLAQDEVPRSRSEILGRLRDAARTRNPVEIERGQEGWVHYLNGFVVSVGAQWMVLQRLAESVHIDGYDVLRISDITDVADDQENGYVMQGVTALGGHPETDLRVPDDAGAKEVLRVAADHSSLISVALEAQWDSPLVIGHLLRLGDRKFEMQLINPRGVWTSEPSRWWYKDITKVTVGNRYAGDLHRFGDARR